MPFRIDRLVHRYKSNCFIRISNYYKNIVPLCINKKSFYVSPIPVTLYSRDNISTFIAFTISAREDEILNGKNGRPLHLHPGRIFPSRYSDEGMISPNCNNTVIQANINPKYHVEVSLKNCQVT